MEGDINRQFISQKFKELKDSISSPDGVVEPADLEKAFRAREINEQETVTLAFELLKRNKVALADAEGKLKRYGIKEQIAKPRAFGEKGHVEVSRDGTFKAS